MEKVKIEPETNTESPEKELLPFQALINGIEKYIEFHEVKSQYVWGYVNGLEKTKEVCMKLLEVQEQELKEIFEQGQKNPELDSDSWFNEKYIKKENTHTVTQLEIDHEENEIDAIYTPESRELVANSSKTLRIIVYCLFHFFAFLYFTLYTVFLILTLQLKKLTSLPSIAERVKEQYKKILNL
jgi:hypothetical protein